MRFVYTISSLLLATLLIAGCTRENDIIEPEPLPPGGKGGKITLNITPQHHKKNINSTTIYIWYAQTTQPDLRSFDDSMNVQIDQNLGRPVATFTDLTQGDYYIYAKGNDYDLEPGNDFIDGGTHYRVIDTLEKTYDLYLQMDNHRHHD